MTQKSRIARLSGIETKTAADLDRVISCVEANEACGAGN